MNTKKIIEGLERCGFRLIENYEDRHLLFRRDIEKIPFIFVVVMPHEGNGNRIMLRADPEENHDRWSNCDFQRFYKNEYDLIENWNRILIFNYDECN